MNRKLFFMLLLLCMAVVAKGQKVSLVTEDAAFKKARILLGDTTFDYDYYIGEVEHDIKPELLVPTLPKNTGKVWLVFVDEVPNGSWEHSCKYVYISKTGIDYYEIVDSVRPPVDVTLSPIYKPNRYGDNAGKKPMVHKIQSNDPNVAAGNTYAVILNGGMTPSANREQYWNDCSFIYKTLRNRYEIPKQNIKVIMSDGTSEEPDMNPIVGYSYVSSPLDLDDDGQPDIEYAATKENLQHVFSELAGKLTDNDHLLFFVTDHGGRNKTAKKSFIYLWNGVELYPEELAAYLEPIDAGFISIVMGQCYSGGFIDELQRPNRIIATACAEDEMSFCNRQIPYNEFLYHWTSALNGYDAFGTETDCNRNIPIMDAQLYAAKHDFYANGGTKYASETPQINYFTNSVAAELSLSNIPPVVDIVFDDYKKPLVSELKTKAYTREFGITRPGYSQTGYWRKESDYLFWNNPYIWLRNDEDGEENQKSERLTVEKYKPVFVYFKVRNRGVKDYAGGTQIVKGYWAEANLAINLEGWQGVVDVNNPSEKYIGGSIGECSLEYIPAGESSINNIWYSFKKGELDVAQKPGFNMCVLIYIRDEYELGTMPIDEDRIVEVWKTNKLGQSNLSLALASQVMNNDSAYVKVSNLSMKAADLSVQLVYNGRSISDLFKEAKVSMKLSPDMVDSWNKGGQKAMDIKLDKNSANVFVLESDTCEFSNLRMNPYQTGKIGLVYNFLADDAITERKEYDVDVALVDNKTGKCLGGETFRVVQEPRPAINPEVVSNLQPDGKMLLTATNVSEEVVYKWYDAEGKIVGTGETFEVPAGAASSYTVRAEAVSDGAISDSKAVTAESTSIKSVDARGGSDDVNVDFYGSVPAGSTLRVTSANGRTPVQTYSVESGVTSYQIPASGLPSGVYQVTLIENGLVTGVKKFAK